MSGGKEQKNTNQMIDKQTAENTAFNQRMQAQAGGRGDTSYNRNTQTYDDLYKGYKDLAGGTGVFAPGMGGSGGGGGVPSYVAPNFDAGKYGDVQGMYREFMGKQGGLDPDRVASMDQDISGLKAIGKYGAADQTSADRLRGGGVYDEYAKTGGISDAESYGIRDRAARTGRAVTAGASDQLQRLTRASGGNVNAAALARMSRQGAQAANQSQLDAETGIADMRRQGRQWGAQGMTSSENQIVQNQMGGLGSAFGAGNKLANDIRSGRQWGTTGLEGIADKEAEAGARAQAAASSAAANSSADQRYQDALRMAGLGGLMDLRGQETGQENTYAGQALGSQGQTSGSNAQLINERIQNNPRKTFGDYFGQIVGAAAGGLTGFGSAMQGIKAIRG